MTQLQLLTDLANIGAGLLFWVCFAFPFVIAMVWPWWQSWWGRNIVSLEIALAMALLPSVLHRELELSASTYLFGWIIVGALFAAAAIVIWRGVMIFRVQRREKNGDV